MAIEESIRQPSVFRLSEVFSFDKIFYLSSLDGKFLIILYADIWAFLK